MTSSNATSSKNSPNPSIAEQTNTVEETVRVPNSSTHPRANAFETELAAAGFTNVKWEVGEQGGASPNRALSAYQVENTNPAGGAQLDPSNLVQVIIYLPPNEI